MTTTRRTTPKPPKFERHPDPASTDPLVGLRFLLLNEVGDPTWQGQFLAAVAPGIYLVELFGWIMGDRTEMRIMPLTRFVTTDNNKLGAVLIDDNYDVSLVWGPYQEGAKYRREKANAAASGEQDENK